MDVSPKTLREVEFREKMRGYHPEDVDQFLEQVASGLEVLQDRLRQAVERAQRAEQAASESGGNDETLRRTLVLAQRTADMAVQEAREQAARILAGAEQQAQSMLSEADERARGTYEERVAEAREELARLEAVRQQAQTDVDALSRWVDEHRHHLAAALQDALAQVERAGLTAPPPTSHPVEVPSATAAPGGTAAQATDASSGPETAAWSPVDAGDEPAEASGDPYFAQLRRAVADTDPPGATSTSRPEAEDARLRPGGESDRPVAASPAGGHGDPERPATEPGGLDRPSTQAGRPGAGSPAGDAHEQALDDFFEDDDNLGEDRRFGGRLRRRR